MELERSARAPAPFHRQPGLDASRAHSTEDPNADRATDPGRKAQVGVAVAISDEAIRRFESDAGPGRDARAALAGREAADAEPESDAAAEGTRTGPGQDLTREEEEEVRKLRARDVEVRAHENAHKAAAGRHARGGPTYEYQRGPDGQQYAVGGEVSIDTSAVAGDPDATIRKMDQVRRAALAPAEPSPQDRRVAAEASRTATAARAEKMKEREEASPEGRRGQRLDLIA